MSDMLVPRFSLLSTTKWLILLLFMCTSTGQFTARTELTRALRRRCDPSDWACRLECRDQHRGRTGFCRKPDPNTTCFGQPIDYPYVHDRHSDLPAHLEALSSFPKCWSRLGPLLCAAWYRPCTVRLYTERRGGVILNGTVELWQRFRDGVCLTALQDCPMLDRSLLHGVFDCGDTDADGLEVDLDRINGSATERRLLFTHMHCEKMYDKKPSLSARRQCMWPLVGGEGQGAGSVRRGRAVAGRKSSAWVVDDCYLPCRNALLPSDHAELAFRVARAVFAGCVAVVCLIVFMYLVQHPSFHRSLFVMSIGNGVFSAVIYYGVWTAANAGRGLWSAVECGGGGESGKGGEQWSEWCLWCGVLLHWSQLAGWAWMASAVFFRLAEMPSRVVGVGGRDGRSSPSRSHDEPYSAGVLLDVRATAWYAVWGGSGVAAAALISTATWAHAEFEHDGASGVCMWGLYSWWPVGASVALCLLVLGVAWRSGSTRGARDCGRSGIEVDEEERSIVAEQERHPHPDAEQVERSGLVLLTLVTTASVLCAALLHPLLVRQSREWERDEMRRMVECTVAASVHSNSLWWLETRHQPLLVDPYERADRGERSLLPSHCHPSVDYVRLPGVFVVFLLLPALPWLIIAAMIAAGLRCNKWWVIVLRSSEEPNQLRRKAKSGLSDCESTELLELTPCEDSGKKGMGEAIEDIDEPVERPRFASTERAVVYTSRTRRASDTVSEEQNRPRPSRSRVRVIDLHDRYAQHRATVRRAFSAGSCVPPEQADSQATADSGSGSMPSQYAGSLLRDGVEYGSIGNMTSISQQPSNALYYAGVREGQWKERCAMYSRRIDQLAESLAKATMMLEAERSAEHHAREVQLLMDAKRALLHLMDACGQDSCGQGRHAATMAQSVLDRMNVSYEGVFGELGIERPRVDRMDMAGFTLDPPLPADANPSEVALAEDEMRVDMEFRKRVKKEKIEELKRNGLNLTRRKDGYRSSLLLRMQKEREKKRLEEERLLQTAEQLEIEMEERQRREMEERARMEQVQYQHQLPPQQQFVSVIGSNGEEMFFPAQPGCAPNIVLPPGYMLEPVPPEERRQIGQWPAGLPPQHWCPPAYPIQPQPFPPQCFVPQTYQDGQPMMPMHPQWQCQEPQGVIPQQEQAQPTPTEADAPGPSGTGVFSGLADRPLPSKKERAAMRKRQRQSEERGREDSPGPSTSKDCEGEKRLCKQEEEEDDDEADTVDEIPIGCDMGEAALLDALKRALDGQAGEGGGGDAQLVRQLREAIGSDGGISRESLMAWRMDEYRKAEKNREESVSSEFGVSGPVVSGLSGRELRQRVATIRQLSTNHMYPMEVYFCLAYGNVVWQWDERGIRAGEVVYSRAEIMEMLGDGPADPSTLGISAEEFHREMRERAVDLAQSVGLTWRRMRREEESHVEGAGGGEGERREYMPDALPDLSLEALGGADAVRRAIRGDLSAVRQAVDRVPLSAVDMMRRGGEIGELMCSFRDFLEHRAQVDGVRALPGREEEEEEEEEQVEEEEEQEGDELDPSSDDSGVE